MMPGFLPCAICKGMFARLALSVVNDEAFTQAQAVNGRLWVTEVQLPRSYSAVQ